MLGSPASLKRRSFGPTAAAIECHLEEIKPTYGGKVDDGAGIDQDCVCHSSGDEDQVAFDVVAELRW